MCLLKSKEELQKIQEAMNLMLARMGKFRRSMMNAIDAAVKEDALSWTEVRIVMRDLSEDLSHNIAIVEGRQMNDKESLKEKMGLEDRPSYFG